jgi:hypothetical protein
MVTRAFSTMSDGRRWVSRVLAATAVLGALHGLAEVDAGERPHEAPEPGQADALTGQAAQPDDGHADPEAGLKALKAECEASLKELKAEIQALRDSRLTVPSMPGSIGRKADQPDGAGRPVDQKNQKEAKPGSGRPWWWSNAKFALYGGVSTTVTLGLADRFAPGVPRLVAVVAGGAVIVIAALVSDMRAGWKRKQDDSPDKPRH